MLGLRTFTPGEFAFYDITGDGRISIADSTSIEYMFLFERPNPDVLNYKLVLDPSNGNSFILAQAIWPATGEVIRETKIGSGAVETSLVETRTVMANRVCSDEFRVGKDGGNTYGVTQTFTTIEGKDVTATKGIVTDVSNTDKTKLTVPLPAEFGGLVSFLGGIDAISIVGEDMNTIKETGFYRGYEMLNAAVGNISSFLVIKLSADWITQVQFVMSASSPIYIRSFHSGTTWSAWREI